MTREEAITILKDLWRYEHTEYTDKEVRNALDIAIKVLEQETKKEWIFVSDGLPKEGEKLIDDDVLVFCEDGQIRVGFCMGADLNGNREWCVAGEYSKVIAWMPLPEGIYTEQSRRLSNEIN